MVASTFAAMKQFTILFVALLMLIKPLWPVGEYIMNYDYIVNVLCENKDKPRVNCDGKCYLMKLMAEESGQKEKNPFENQQTKTQGSQTLYFSDIKDFHFGADLYCKTNNITEYLSTLKTLHLIFKIIHPPQ